MGSRQAKDGQNCISGKLFKYATMIRDYTLNMRVVAFHQRADILWVKCFLKCSGLRHIGEENTYQLSFLWKRCSCLAKGRTRLYRHQSSFQFPRSMRSVQRG